MCKDCQRLYQENQRLKAKLQHAIYVASKLAVDSEGIMKKGNLPRGRWAYLKGLAKSANAILGVLAK